MVVAFYRLQNSRTFPICTGLSCRDIGKKRAICIEGNVTEDECQDKGCCFDDTETVRLCGSFADIRPIAMHRILPLK